MTSPELKPRGAIITGGGSGINLALAKALRDKGCAILIGDISLHKEAQEWLRSTKQDGGPKISFQYTDVTIWDHLERLFDIFASQIGGVPDVVVPGAGIYEASSPSFWNERDSNSHYKLLEINLVHPIRLTRIAFRRMRQAQTTGVVIHESSIVAIRPSPVLPLYATSKAGLSHFVRSMAALGDMTGIRVVAVAPGIVDTPLFRDHEAALDHIDVKNDFLLPVDEVVRAMIALATDTNYKSGTVLEVNDVGGWREVQLLNEPGPQGKSKESRAKAAEAIKEVKAALLKDVEVHQKTSKL